MIAVGGEIKCAFITVTFGNPGSDGDPIGWGTVPIYHS